MAQRIPVASGPFAMVALALSLVGCPRPADPPPPPPPPRDGGPIVGRDAGPVLGVDTDSDGLCDRTEWSMGTDPNRSDTDSDGLTDRVEVDLGYLPLEPGSPDRSLLLFMEETPEANAQLPYELEVRAEGQTYTGAFEFGDASDPLGLTALDFLASARAIGAIPMENVFEVQAETQRFVIVDGRTQLVWELRFAFGEQLPRSCIRAYPFRYQVKRDDGRLVALDPYLLVILPHGQRLDTAQWCRPRGDCI